MSFIPGFILQVYTSGCTSHHPGYTLSPTVGSLPPTVGSLPSAVVHIYQRSDGRVKGEWAHLSTIGWPGREEYGHIYQRSDDRVEEYWAHLSTIGWPVGVFLAHLSTIGWPDGRVYCTFINDRMAGWVYNGHIYQRSDGRMGAIWVHLSTIGWPEGRNREVLSLF